MDAAPKLEFYGTFQQIINDARDSYLNDDRDEQLLPPEVRLLMLEESGQTVEVVKTMAPSLKMAMGKPQQLIHDDPDYYIACDMLTKTYYVCYRNLLMVDIDFYKKSDSEEEKAKSIEQRQADIIELIGNYGKENGWLFDIYRSRNGVHAFLLNHSADRNCSEDIQIMLDLKCDFFYVVYSHLRGWSVRVNRKSSEPIMSYHFLERVGRGQADEHLENLVRLHINLIDVFKDTEPSTMYGT
jgi:hypothetical protein